MSNVQAINDPKYIILHCSDSNFGSADLINKWHKERGWKGIGYHYVILNSRTDFAQRHETLDGEIQLGRKVSEIGAHCLGYNDKSIGICLIGRKKFTEKQMESAVTLVKRLMNGYNIPIKNVLGHCETENAHRKTCPNFDMNEFRAKLI